MYMIIIKVDCCGRPQTSSDAMRFKRLDVLRCYAGERVKDSNNVDKFKKKTQKTFLFVNKGFKPTYCFYYLWIL